MNIYVIVEGEVGEKKVYENWIPFVNHTLSYAPTINEVKENNYYIFCGGGYPQLFDAIEGGVEDVLSIVDGNGSLVFDRLVVALDSEDDTLEQREMEMSAHISSLLAQRAAYFDYKVIVQHFCLETWALGNRKIFTSNIRLPELKKYIAIHNVATSDPQLLPDLHDEEINRAQFALSYLTKLLNNKFRNCSYSKNNPEALLNEKYFMQVKQRFEQTGHISSFSGFLQAFQ